MEDKRLRQLRRLRALVFKYDDRALEALRAELAAELAEQEGSEKKAARQKTSGRDRQKRTGYDRTR